MALQVAIIPYRLKEAGEVEVLLVTSRRKGRWVLPKGTVKPGISVSAAAATEAFEEAGVLGTIEDKEIFSYRDTKSLTKGGKLDVRVVVHVMMVSSEAPIWPEMHERERRWLEPEAALQVLIGKYLKGSVRAFLKHKQFSSEP